MYMCVCVHILTYITCTHICIHRCSFLQSQANLLCSDFPFILSGNYRRRSRFSLEDNNLTQPCRLVARPAPTSSRLLSSLVCCPEAKAVPGDPKAVAASGGSHIRTTGDNFLQEYGGKVLDPNWRPAWIQAWDLSQSRGRVSLLPMPPTLSSASLIIHPLSIQQYYSLTLCVCCACLGHWFFPECLMFPPPNNIARR